MLEIKCWNKSWKKMISTVQFRQHFVGRKLHTLEVR